MAAIQYDARLETQVEKEYHRWRIARPRQPGQLGSTAWLDVKGGPYPDNTVYRQFPDAFVDELEGSGIADRLIKKGVIYSPAYGEIAFSAPLFGDYLQRTSPKLLDPRISLSL